MSQSVKTFNLKLTSLLNKGEEEASLLVRVMMACNDITLANRCLGYFKSSNRDFDNHMKRGACLYFVKIQCSHLREAHKLVIEIKEIMKNNNIMQRTYESCSDNAKNCFEELEHVNMNEFSRIVVGIRNYAGFHYNKSKCKNAIKKRSENKAGNDVTINVSDDIRLNRYNLADDVLDTLICREVLMIDSSITGKALQTKVEKCMTFIADLSVKFVNFSFEFIDIYLDDIIIAQRVNNAP